MSDSVPISISRVEGSTDFFLSSYKFAGGADKDIHAANPSKLRAQPGNRVVMFTAIRMILQSGSEVFVRAHSGMASERGMALLNLPVMIDPNYGGRIGVLSIAFGTDIFDIQGALRIAQLVFAPFVEITFFEVRDFSSTMRGGRFQPHVAVSLK